MRMEYQWDMPNKNTFSIKPIKELLKEEMTEGKWIDPYANKKGGKVISVGWNSVGMGKKYGFQKERILLVSQGGSHNDTIVVVERKVK